MPSEALAHHQLAAGCTLAGRAWRVLGGAAGGTQPPSGGAAGPGRPVRVARGAGGAPALTAHCRPNTDAPARAARHARRRTEVQRWRHSHASRVCQWAQWAVSELICALASLKGAAAKGPSSSDSFKRPHPARTLTCHTARTESARARTSPLGANSVQENIWPRRLHKSIVTVLRGMYVISPALAALFWADLHPLLEAPCALGG